MKTKLENKKFDTMVEPSDWRYAAAIVGLHKYLSHFGENGIDFEVSEDGICFNQSSITEDRYLNFVEWYYEDELDHVKLERILKKEEFSTSDLNEAKNIMSGPTAKVVLKKVFNGLIFDGTNSEEIQAQIDNHRAELIKETYRNKANMYKNYAKNTGYLLQMETKEKGKNYCRLFGYYIDGGKKSRSVSYNFDPQTYAAQDDMLFDFIPFAFQGNKESFFINDNYSVIQLLQTNRNFERKLKEVETASDGSPVETWKKNPRKVLVQSIRESSDFLDYDVEVISKDQNQGFFETLYIRKDSIEIFKGKSMERLFFLPWPVLNDAISCILNLIRTDNLIDSLLKPNSSQMKDMKIGQNTLRKNVDLLIEINVLICKGGTTMRREMIQAKCCANDIAACIPENKLSSYRQRLTSAIVCKDYDRYCQVLMQLSNYAGNVSSKPLYFNFAFSLFEDFEANKDIAYTFINALAKKTEKQGNTGTTETKQEGN